MIESDRRWTYYWQEGVDPNRLWDLIVVIFVSCANKLYSRKKYKTWKNSPEWVDEKVVPTIRKKNPVYNKAKHSGEQRNWDEYRFLKGKSSRLLRRKRRLYLVNTLAVNRTNRKQFSKEIGKNLNVGRHKPKSCCTRIENGSGDIVVDQEAAEFMNEYYINMGSNLARKFDKEWEPTDSLIL